MPSIMEQMVSYSSYHRAPRNKCTHFFGVPLVVFSLLIVMGWFRFAPMAIPLSLGTLFVAGVTLYYLRLDRLLAFVQLPFSAALLYGADRISTLPFGESAAIFGVSFVGGWIIQLLGHVFEGKRPALVDNILQVFNAPMFLALELLFILGFRKEMRATIEERLPASGPGRGPAAAKVHQRVGGRDVHQKAQERG